MQRPPIRFPWRRHPQKTPPIGGCNGNAVCDVNTAHIEKQIFVGFSELEQSVAFVQTVVRWVCPVGSAGPAMCRVGRDAVGARIWPRRS